MDTKHLHISHSSRPFVFADNAMAWLVTASLRWESEPAAQAVIGLLALALPKIEVGQTTAK